MAAMRTCSEHKWKHDLLPCPVPSCPRARAAPWGCVETREAGPDGRRYGFLHNRVSLRTDSSQVLLKVLDGWAFAGLHEEGQARLWKWQLVGARAISDRSNWDGEAYFTRARRAERTIPPPSQAASWSPSLGTFWRDFRSNEPDIKD